MNLKRQTTNVFSLDAILSEKLNYRNRLIAETHDDTHSSSGATGGATGSNGNGIKSKVQKFVLDILNKIKEKQDIKENLSEEFKADKNKIELVLNKFLSLVSNATLSFSVDSASFSQKDCNYEINALLNRKDIPTQSVYQISINGCNGNLRITNIQDKGGNKPKVLTIVPTEMECVLLKNVDKMYTEIGVIKFVNTISGIKTTGELFGLQEFKGKSLFIHITEFGYVDCSKNGDHFNPYNEFYSAGKGEKSLRSICDLGNIMINEEGKGTIDTVLPRVPIDLYPGRSLTLSEENYGKAIGCGIIGITKFNIK